jgi:hypothetical protein
VINININENYKGNNILQIKWLKIKMEATRKVKYFSKLVISKFKISSNTIKKSYSKAYLDHR